MTNNRPGWFFLLLMVFSFSACAFLTYLVDTTHLTSKPAYELPFLFWGYWTGITVMAFVGYIALMLAITRRGAKISISAQAGVTSAAWISSITYIYQSGWTGSTLLGISVSIALTLTTYVLWVLKR